MPIAMSDRIKAQAKHMLANLTLEQKIGQMALADQATCAPQDARDFFLGGVMSSAGSCPGENELQDWLAMGDKFWHASAARDDQLTAIPILYGLDAIHGNANVKGATIFPHNIGLGASRSEADIQAVATVTGDEVRAIGANWIFGPNLALAQHYHWGRTYESVSSSPEEIAWFARTYMNSLNAGRTDYPILACAKHFVGDGGTDYGIEQGDTRQSLKKLELHIKPFRAAIDAGVLSIMVAFSGWNGDKCHGNAFLISHLLKDQLGFDGFVLSDMHGINTVDDDFYSALGQGVNAGIDMFMVPQSWRQFIQTLLKHVELGTVSITRINDAVERILRAKIALGLFDQAAPSERSKPYLSRFGCEQHRTMARKAASHSCVLLKNDKQVLPLKSDQKILITGKGAKHTGMQCGGFTLEWQGVQDAFEIPGATDIASGIAGAFRDTLHCPPDQVNDSTIEGVDVAVVVIGEKPYAEGLGDIRETDRVLIEAGSRMDGYVTIQPPYGRSLELSQLHPEDIQVLRQLKQFGIPTVAVLLNGRPLIIDDELALSDAFLTAWLPGSEGESIADLLSGEQDFIGRLAFPWPTANGHVPINPNAVAGQMSYAEIWPKGHGLSYSSDAPVKVGLKTQFRRSG